MANHKSAVKRARQNDKRRARNNGLRTKAKTEAKSALTLITGAGSREEALKALAEGQRRILKASSKGAFPKARASRKIARLAALVNKKFAAPAARASK